MTSDTSSEPARRKQARADATRQALLDAATVEFAAHGFEGASTRAIAARAGTHQPQINYHFESKDALWRAAVDQLFGRLDDLIGDLEPVVTEPDPATIRADFARAIRGLVHAASQLPELIRIMVQETTADSDRLAWIVERHTRPRFDDMNTNWRAAAAAGAVPAIDELVVYYTVIGGAWMAYVSAAEARHLVGGDAIDDRFVEAHADALVRLVLGPDHPDD